VVATILTGMLYGLENIDEEDLPEPQHDEPVLPLFQQQAIEAFSATNISPTAWARPFHSGLPASFLSWTGLNVSSPNKN
jgi:hypothetical protein